MHIIEFRSIATSRNTHVVIHFVNGRQLQTAYEIGLKNPNKIFSVDDINA